MKKIIAIILFAFLAFSGTVQASTLTQNQISAIIGLLEAFNVDQSVINQVQSELMPVPIVGSVQMVPYASSTQEIKDYRTSWLIQNYESQNTQIPNCANSTLGGIYKPYNWGNTECKYDLIQYNQSMNDWISEQLQLQGF